MIWLTRLLDLAILTKWVAVVSTSQITYLEMRTSSKRTHTTSSTYSISEGLDNSLPTRTCNLRRHKSLCNIENRSLLWQRMWVMAMKKNWTDSDKIKRSGLSRSLESCRDWYATWMTALRCALVAKMKAYATKTVYTAGLSEPRSSMRSAATTLPSSHSLLQRNVRHS